MRAEQWTTLSTLLFSIEKWCSDNEMKMSEEQSICKFNQTRFCKFGKHCQKNQIEDKICENSWECTFLLLQQTAVQSSILFLYPLWVWARALALRGSSIIKTQIQRGRATPSDVLPNAKKNIDYFQSRPDQAYVACRPLTSVYLALNGVEGFYVTTESVILDIEMWPNIPCYVFASAWLCGSASKWALKTWWWSGCCK